MPLRSKTFSLAFLFHNQFVSSFLSNTAFNLHGRLRTSLNNKMELLDKRLRDVGAKNYAFVNLDDGSVAEGLGSHAENIIVTRIDANGNATTIPNTIEHIKTLIWEAVLLVPEK